MEKPLFRSGSSFEFNRHRIPLWINLTRDKDGLSVVMNIQADSVACNFLVWLI
jgi:hypothetical protein